MVVNIPVILMPVAAAEQTSNVSSFVANVASVAVLGSALGKLVNGFVCEALGSQKSSFWYLIGLSICTRWFSSGQIKWANAGMEFFAAIQWTSLSVFLERKYQSDARGYCKALAAMELAYTGGQIVMKSVGALLLQYLHWQTIANAASLVSIFGSLIALISLREQPSIHRKPLTLSKIGLDCAELAKSPTFWSVGISYSAVMLGRSNDRVLGAFIHEETMLSPRLCGGLTLCSTLGLIYGLNIGHVFFTLDHIQKKQFLVQRYMWAIVSALSLALCAAFPDLSTPVKVVWIAASGFGLACNTCFLYVNIPNLVSKTFDAQAITLGAIDAIGFFTAAPCWRYFGVLALHYGFSASWIMVASVLLAGGALMIQGIKPVLIDV
jgi:hypothetical protein